MKLKVAKYPLKSVFRRLFKLAIRTAIKILTKY